MGHATKMNAHPVTNPPPEFSLASPQTTNALIHLSRPWLRASSHTLGKDVRPPKLLRDRSDSMKLRFCFFLINKKNAHTLCCRGWYRTSRLLLPHTVQYACKIPSAVSQDPKWAIQSLYRPPYRGIRGGAGYPKENPCFHRPVISYVGRHFYHFVTFRYPSFRASLDGFCVNYLNHACLTSLS